MRYLTAISITTLAVALAAFGCSPGTFKAKQAFNDGMHSSERGRYVEAILHLGKAIQLAPDDAKAYNNRGQA